MKQLYTLLLLAFLFIPGFVSAIPTTSAATMVGNNNATWSATGGSGTYGWFQWGMKSGQTWAHTPNVTITGGAFSYTMRGTPMFGNTAYYFKACDETGCGAQQTFTTLVVTPLPLTTFGAFAVNITENGFEPQNAFWNAMRPYTAVTGETIFYGLIFALVFVGLWLRTRGTAVASMFGMICVGLFASAAVGLQLGLPPEFVSVGQALLYLSLTGAIMAFTFK